MNKAYFLKAYAEVRDGKALFECFPLLCEREVRAIQSGEILPDEFFVERRKETSIDIGGVIYVDGKDNIPEVVNLRRPKNSEKPQLHKGTWFDIVT